MPKSKRSKLHIEAVLSTKNGEPITRAQAGAPIRIVGSGFADDPKDVRVYFDQIEAHPYRMPFSDSSLVVSCPMPDKPTSMVHVDVGTAHSNELEFTVTPPARPKGQPGAATAEFIHALDQYAAMVSSLAHHAGPTFDLGDGMQQAADYVDGGRLILQRNLQILQHWQPVQAAIDFAPLRTIERVDEVIALGGLTQQIDRLTDNTFGGAGILSTVLGGPGALGSFIFGIDAESVGDFVSTGVGIVGFVLKEGAKLLEGIENYFKIFVPSASTDTGISLGGELTLGVDVSFSFGEGVSAIAKGVDIVAQIFEKIGDSIDGDDLDEALGRLEEKADRQGEAFDRMEGKADRGEEKLDLIESKSDRQEQKLDRLEGKADRQEEKLDVIESKADRQEQKLDRLEGKADRQTEKLDTLEAKADRHEQKLDAVESKADRQEEKLDTIEAKEDRQEQKLDAIESKNDRQEEKLDKLEEKADRHEQKLDKIEGKADRQEQKLDRLEGKADRHEQKLDRLEGKADRQEKKLDGIESKADRHEQKLDRLEGKADRQERKLDTIEGKNDRQEQKLDSLEGKADRQEQKLDSLEEKNDRQEGKLDRLEEKSDRHEEKLDRLEEKADRIEEKHDREEEKLDRLSAMPPFEGSIANQRGGARRVTAAVAAIRGRDNNVFIRAAIDQEPADLDDENSWSDWVNFGRPNVAAVIVEVSIDLQYEEGSNTTLNALLSARDQDGRVYHRVFERLNHGAFLDPDQWSAWQTFLDQP